MFTTIRRVSVVQTSKNLQLGVRYFTETTEKSLCTKLCIIGGGQMCEAILEALRIKGIQKMKDIVVVDSNTKRLDFLAKKTGVNISQCAEEASRNAEITILSVKPQNVATVANQINRPFHGLLLSICAGVTVADLSKKFGTQEVIRTMPNTPAMVLEGITVWTATKETPQELKDKAKILMQSFGEDMEVHDEHYIDMATAVSGSGPAYVFLTMEAMIDAAVHLGFPREMATKLVISTIKGSAIYAQQSEQHTAKLRNSVTSPGGTTASALYALDRGGFRTVVADAIWAAYRRTLELGNNNPQVGPGKTT